MAAPGRDGRRISRAPRARSRRGARKVVATSAGTCPAFWASCSASRLGFAGSYAMIGMIRIATMFATLIMGLIAGPAVSL
jgi:hypothetical protein